MIIPGFRFTPSRLLSPEPRGADSNRIKKYVQYLKIRLDASVSCVLYYTYYEVFPLEARNGTHNHTLR